MREKIDFTLDLVKRAGENIKELMINDVVIDTKSANNDFVTNVDKQTELFLVNGIKERFENQDFLTEEKVVATQGLDDLWIVDPIDGTTNFIFERRNFAISIAFYHKKKPVFGIVYDVVADELFLGITGEGAFLNGKKLPMLDQTTQLKDSIVFGDLYSLTMFGNDVEAFRSNFVAHRYLGAASIEICGVAMNRHQVYMSKNLKVWDVAAGAIVLNEVGGTFEFDGLLDDIYYNDNDGEWFSCLNKTILKELTELKQS